jgi:magnesium-protoporphyrin O-methyltransferase
MFNRRFAERDARAFREHGVRGSARTLVELAGDVRGATVLDVGGGVGGIGLELLAAGAQQLTNVELSGAYEEAARTLAQERGVENRVDRRIGDFVDAGEGIEAHDVVVMHRVVCCYPDLDGLMDAAATHARRVVVLTYPQERWWVKVGLRTVNGFLRVRRCGFRTYVHPVARILAERDGLRVARRERHGLLWESAALAR